MKIAADSVRLGNLALCEVRLMNDRRWPWLLLLPQRAALVELHDLEPADLTRCATELALASRVLSQVTGALKINTGALGNVVRQLHFHVIARNAGDANWPGPVWGFGERQAYEQAMMEKLSASLSSRLFN